MLAFLTINGMSATAVATIGTAGLIVLGFLLPAAGMLRPAPIPASNIALLAGWLLDIDKNIYQDIGATLAGCGSVLAAYSFFVRRRRGQAPAVSLP